jgi:formyltetrahydrofolate synthetase
MIDEIIKKLGITPYVAINRVKTKNTEEVELFKKMLEQKGIKSYLRYEID